MKSPLSKHSPLRALVVFLVSMLLLGFTSGATVAQEPYSPPGPQLVGLPTTIAPPRAVVRIDDYKGDSFVPPPVRSHLGDTPSGPAAPAAATFTVALSGTFPISATEAITYAINIWSGLIDSSVPISVTLEWYDLGGGGVLGRGGPCTMVAAGGGFFPLDNVWYPSALANKLANFDIYPAVCDIDNTFNSNPSVNWFYDLPPLPGPGAGEIDFASVVLHEIGHGLGFIGSMRVDNGTGSPECSGAANEGCWGLGPSTYPVVYDCFTADNVAYTADNLIVNPPYANPSVALGTALRNTGYVRWGGINVTQHADNPDPNRNVELYAPPAWAQGSSYSHWDEDAFPQGDTNSLMTPYISDGEAIHNPGPITLALFDDIGWDGSGSASPGCPSDPTVVTLKSMDASNVPAMNVASASQSGNGTTVPLGLLIGLGAALIGTTIWLVVSFRRAKQRS